ncbi:MAG TPA: homoserine O-succinyltransferase [Steroidobacteraceae bacterium]|nr:homoserine O-succinyltransferase [Steroidobacteraceae bacterium]
MNASVKSVCLAPRHAAAAVAGGSVTSLTPEIVVREGILEVPGEMALHHGGRLAGVRIAWRLAGAANAPVVCALGGISASRRVCLSEDPRQDWWPQVAGPGRPLDSNHYRVLSFDYLGGSGESTGPEPGWAPGSARAFPTLSSYDQAEALQRLLDHLGIKSLRAIAGGSYGGMVALAFGERYPERVGHLLIIGASDHAHPMATAWRSVQRRLVRFALECGQPKQGLQLARALAMATYRTHEEFSARFTAEPVRDGEQFLFPVESYLFARGSDYAARHRPESFLCLSESIDLHAVDASRIFVPTTAVAVREDQLVPLADIRGMVARLPAARLHELSSIYGHDAFLKETEQLRRIFIKALEGAS